MKTIICPCSLFSLWVLNFFVPSIVYTSLTLQSAHSYCPWALQRLFLQLSLLLWRSCMTWRYSSLLTYHKSYSSHSFSFVFSCCFIWNANMYREPKPSFEFPSITQRVIRIGFQWIMMFLTTDFFCRKCCEICTASSFTWKTKKPKNEIFLGQKEKKPKQTNKQILEAWRVCFFSKPTFLLFAFMDMFFLSIFILRLLPMWDIFC